MADFTTDGSSKELSQEQVNQKLLEEGFKEYPAQFGNDEERTSRFYQKGGRRLMVVSYDGEEGVTWVYGD